MIGRQYLYSKFVHCMEFKQMKMRESLHQNEDRPHIARR